MLSVIHPLLNALQISLHQSAANLAESVSDQADTIADDAARLASSQVSEIATQGKSKTEHLVRSISRAIEAGSQSLEEDGMPGTAGYVRAAANGLNRAASEVDGFNTSRVGGNFERFIRDRPLLTVGALAIAGFAMASLVSPRDDKDS